MSEMKENTKQNSIIAGDGKVRPLAVNSLEDGWIYSKYIMLSKLAPKSLIEGKNSDEAQASIFTAMQMGAEVGLSPMASIQNIAVINGKAAIYGHAQTGIVIKSGKLNKLIVSYEGEEKENLDNSFKCVVYAERINGTGEVTNTSKEFSMGDAARAGLLDKDFWIKYPKDMLAARAKSRVWRELFPDVLHGLACTVEELEESTVKNIKPTAKSEKADALNSMYKVECEVITVESDVEAEEDNGTLDFVEAEFPLGDEEEKI